MSIHHRLEEEELSDTSRYELFSILGERDTPRLFDQRIALDTAHDCPTGAGNTVERKTVLIDRTLYQQVQDNEFKASGLTPQQIISAWIEHEHSEICIVAGDNPIDTQLPAHRRALRLEHLFVGFCVGEKGIPKYEATIWPALVACYNRPIKKPHPAMWCGPLLDHPSERDEEIIAELQKLGVADAAKRSKHDVHYGFGAYQCKDCRNFGATVKTEEIAPCAVVDGTVRADRHCDLFRDASVKAMARADDDDKLSHEAVSYGPGRNGEFCRTCRYSDHAEKPRCALVVDIDPKSWCRLWSPMGGP